MTTPRARLLRLRWASGLLIAQGALTSEQARSHPHRNVVTQALGVTDPNHLNVETMTGELRPGM